MSGENEQDRKKAFDVSTPIKNVSIRHFRSCSNLTLRDCSGLNVIIGKNNSGKSNILIAIDMVMNHLRTGRIASPLRSRSRLDEEFYNRDFGKQIQLGVQFHLSESLRKFIAGTISTEVQGIEVALKEIEAEEYITLVVNGLTVGNAFYWYVHDLGFGTMTMDDIRLQSSGHKILFVPEAVSEEVATIDRDISRYKKDIEALDEAAAGVPSRIWDNTSRDENRFLMRRYGEELRVNLRRRFTELTTKAANQDEFNAAVNLLKSEVRSNLEELSGKETSLPIRSFSGNVRRVPDYVIPILQQLGSLDVQHFREIRKPIGPEEADQLLKLKTRRGGPNRLTQIQTVVKGLLGVSVDAFDASDADEPIRTTSAYRGREAQRSAEMDVDEFLVEANGAGIREALRIVLDVELSKPHIILLEEPEVHLHPGLEKLLHSYLVSKSRKSQIFVATHSTNFIDVSSTQNVYTISRSKDTGSAELWL